MSSATDRQRGVFTVIIALLIPVALAMFGLAIDISHYVWVGNQLQNAADAAAFAGARELNGTSNGRASATGIAALYAQQNTVDGRHVAANDVVENVTGSWDFSTGTFSSAGASDPAANAIRVTVWRQEVPTFFARLLSGTIASQTLSRSAVAVAGGAGGVDCTSPFAIGSCALDYTPGGDMICPSTLSFQNGPGSVGLTLPDGDSPVNGNRAAPYISNVMSDPSGCHYPSSVGDSFNMQNGNDLPASAVNDINGATADGTNPQSIVMAVLDINCGTGGPNYNGSADVSGYIKMDVVGARGTKAAPAHVEAACPGIGKKNICIKPNCSRITGAPAGGTAQVVGIDSHLVK